MQKFHLYILYSEQLDKFYIGFTGESPQIRLEKHLANHNGFTAKAKDWKIIFCKTFNNKTDAQAEERKLKKWKNKARIKNYILKGSTE